MDKGFPNNTPAGGEIMIGGNLTLSSSGDKHYQVAKLDSGADIVIDSGDYIFFATKGENKSGEIILSPL